MRKLDLYSGFRIWDHMTIMEGPVSATTLLIPFPKNNYTSTSNIPDVTHTSDDVFLRRWYMYYAPCADILTFVMSNPEHECLEDEIHDEHCCLDRMDWPGTK